MISSKKLKLMFRKLSLMVGIGVFILLKTNAQDLDSLRYYMNLRTNDDYDKLSEIHQRVILNKIVQFRKLIYYKSKEDKSDTIQIVPFARSLKMRLFEIDSISSILMSISLDNNVNKSKRLDALKLLNSLNTYQADSFLVSNLLDINYLETTEEAGDEISSMFPCAKLLGSKAGKNYGLYKPIMDNLFLAKNESQIFFISLVLSDMFGSELAIEILNSRIATDYDNSIFVKNLELIINQLKK